MADNRADIYYMILRIAKIRLKLRLIICISATFLQIIIVNRRIEDYRSYNHDYIWYDLLNFEVNIKNRTAIDTQLYNRIEVEAE